MLYTQSELEKQTKKARVVLHVHLNDRRYSVNFVYCGRKLPQYNLLFCNKSLGFFNTLDNCLKAAIKHKINLTL